ncbi:SDR family NAD(P)-dependent oxidoreductase [Streptomyces sp. NBC_00154]|uniref:SDR family NAD(P)-dependent oxidoreductase n=1 Tax=Streptomyces sp. NBC_00154 TaxID=2975670 RepID=UPI002250606F|nr:SDR family NAD(P)-dependent oxidoreductase [Streptomyces sp. NBC_00154]MCX5315805.1 SDR family NAD(P)-dependent oxidoreductase [Streptomyces sp. NBC_00154]
MTSPYGIEGRAAIVTGASRGIGLAVAEALAAAGARVCVTARDPEGVGRAAERVGGIGLAGSVADPAHLRELTELALREFGRIDVVVNNAATNQPYGPLMDADPDRWREAFTVNVEAPLRLVQCVWRGWTREHGGAVVNICTEGAGHVGPHVGAYGTGSTDSNRTRDTASSTDFRSPPPSASAHSTSTSPRSIATPGSAYLPKTTVTGTARTGPGK